MSVLLSTSYMASKMNDSFHRFASCCGNKLYNMNTIDRVRSELSINSVNEVGMLDDGLTLKGSFIKINY